MVKQSPNPHELDEYNVVCDEEPLRVNSCVGDMTMLIDGQINHEFSCLAEMEGPEKPFSAMATQLVNEHGRRLRLTDQMD